MALSKQRRYAYYRNLPHLQRENKVLAVTMSTRKRWRLPPEARDRVLECCMREHNQRAFLYALVVMPDHVHLLMSALSDDQGEVYSLAEIMSSIKGATAHAVNRALGRKGQVWEEEFFDHVLRKAESLASAIEYIRQNPVRNGLASLPEEYRWLRTAEQEPRAARLKGPVEGDRPTSSG